MEKGRSITPISVALKWTYLTLENAFKSCVEKSPTWSPSTRRTVFRDRSSGGIIRLSIRPASLVFRKSKKNFRSSYRKEIANPPRFCGNRKSYKARTFVVLPLAPLLEFAVARIGFASPFNSAFVQCAGERELIRWVRMASTLAMGQDKCSDLVLSSLVRARFGELVAPKLKQGESELYLMGLLSLMDAILEVPIGVVIEELPLALETKAQLLCRKTAKQTRTGRYGSGVSRPRS